MVVVLADRATERWDEGPSRAWAGRRSGVGELSGEGSVQGAAGGGSGKSGLWCPAELAL